MHESLQFHFEMWPLLHKDLWVCNTGVDHGACRKKCGRGFATCSHMCTKDCHDGTLCGFCNSKSCEVCNFLIAVTSTDEQ